MLVWVSRHTRHRSDAGLYPVHQWRQDRYPENVRAGRDNPRPGKLSEQIDQRRQLVAGQVLGELDSNVATATVTALTQRHPSHLQTTIPRLDHGDTVGLAGLCRPRFYLEQICLVRLGDQEL